MNSYDAFGYAMAFLYACAGIVVLALGLKAAFKSK